MAKIVAFAILSAVLVYLSRGSLREPRVHGFFRFFAWESILALALLNLNVWFENPFSRFQTISWFLLVVSIVPLAAGVHGLTTKGGSVDHREGDDHLLSFERTTKLVTTGIYHYIRHPLYCSLLLLAWGIFFKNITWSSTLLVGAATCFLFATAKIDETECIRFFGTPYQEYMKRTRRFIPFVL